MGGFSSLGARDSLLQSRFYQELRGIVWGTAQFSDTEKLITTCYKFLLVIRLATCAHARYA